MEISKEAEKSKIMKYRCLDMYFLIILKISVFLLLRDTTFEVELLSRS